MHFRKEAQKRPLYEAEASVAMETAGYWRYHNHGTSIEDNFRPTRVNTCPQAMELEGGAAHDS